MSQMKLNPKTPIQLAPKQMLKIIEHGLKNQRYHKTLLFVRAQIEQMPEGLQFCLEEPKAEDVQHNIE